MNINVHAYHRAIESTRNSRMKAHVGCCIKIHGRKELISGTNTRICAQFPTKTASYHAEMRAIEHILHIYGCARRAHHLIAHMRHLRAPSMRLRCKRRKLAEISIYIARTHHDGATLCNARPCAECNLWFAACEILGIKIRRVFHTDSNGQLTRYEGHPCEFRGHMNLF